MAARIAGFLALWLCFASIGFADDAWNAPAPQPLPRTENGTPVSKGAELPAVEHLRLAARQLEAAGLINDAAAIRSAANQLEQRTIQEFADQTPQIAGVQNRCTRLRMQQLLGRPNLIAYKCRFLELSPKSAAEFYAAAGGEAKHFATVGIAVCPKGVEVFRKLHDAGKLVTLAELSVVALPDQTAIATTGGEFPVLIATSGSAGSIDYRRFGYRCEIVPQVLESNRIQLEASPEIAERDATTSAEFNGLSLPSLTTRRIHATVEMGLGESLVMNMGTRPRDDGHRSAQSALEGAIQLLSGQGETVTLVLITPTAAGSRSK